MSYSTNLQFTKIEDVFVYVKPLVDAYRQFPSKKDVIIEDLMSVFSVSSPALALIVKDGFFVETFHRKMGKGRMKALRKLVYAIDQNYYQQIDFRCD